MSKIKIKKLKIVPDERGCLGEILRNDDPMFDTFGQVYFTTAYSGVVKAWHMHKYQTDNICCIHGHIKLVVVEHTSNNEEQIHEFFIGRHNPLLVQVPAGFYHGFKNIGLEEAIIVNVPNRRYNYVNPDELRLPPTTHKISYNWSRKDG